ncbi:MAG: hypothetical protein AAFX44_19685 [Pseudomonadota bacterium]
MSDRIVAGVTQFVHQFVNHAALLIHELPPNTAEACRRRKTEFGREIWIEQFLIIARVSKDAVAAPNITDLSLQIRSTITAICFQHLRNLLKN